MGIAKRKCWMAWMAAVPVLFGLLFCFNKEESLKNSFLLTSSSCPLPLIAIHLNYKFLHPSGFLLLICLLRTWAHKSPSLGFPLCSSQGRRKTAAYICFYLCNFIMLCSFLGCHFILSKVISVMNAEAQDKIQTLSFRELNPAAQVQVHSETWRFYLASSYCSGQHRTLADPRLYMA